MKEDSGFDRLKQKTPKRIPLINRNDRVIYAHVGNQFSVGTGLYEIIHYDPHEDGDTRTE